MISAKLKFTANINTHIAIFFLTNNGTSFAIATVIDWKNCT
jgi:hypothetical protein